MITKRWAVIQFDASSPPGYPSDWLKYIWPEIEEPIDKALDEVDKPYIINYQGFPWFGLKHGNVELMNFDPTEPSSETELINWLWDVVTPQCDTPEQTHEIITDLLTDRLAKALEPVTDEYGL